MSKQIELDNSDMIYILTRMPKDVRDLLKQNPNKLWLGGGYIRALIAKEEPSDIDLFGTSSEDLLRISDDLKDIRKAHHQKLRQFKTKNAITLITQDRLTVQYITRWVFQDASGVLESFDFTICQAVIWWDGEKWRSTCGERFYPDLAAKRLFYTNPVREEEAGGSMMRVIKFTKRGYNIQARSLGDVIARIVEKMRQSDTAEREPGRVIAGLLREVDPLTVVDGLELVDEHDKVEDITNIPN